MVLSKNVKLANYTKHPVALRRTHHNTLFIKW